MSRLNLILYRILNVRNISASWVPYLLTDEQNGMRINSQAMAKSSFQSSTKGDLQTLLLERDIGALL